MKQAYLLLFIVFLMLPTIGISQQTIKGKIINIETKEELPFANIILLNSNRDSLQFGVTSELNGEFSIKNIPSGNYQLKVSVIGFKLRIIKDIRIEKNNLDLKRISLQPTTLKLDEVIVSAERSYVENKPGKKVINVGQDIINSGGSAIEFLSMAPAVDVGIGGEVSIRGESDVYILINGKETALSHLGAGKALKQIPVSSIEKIEIITSAGSEYTPDGEGGMINIILKKEKNHGMEITVGSELETKPISSSANIGIEYKKKKLGFTLNYNIDHSTEKYTQQEVRKYKLIQNGKKSLITQLKNKNHGTAHFLLGGISYYANDSTETNLTFSYEQENAKKTSSQDYIINHLNSTPQISHSFENSKRKESFLGFELNHEQQFRNGFELELFTSFYKGISKNNSGIKNSKNKHTTLNKLKSKNKYYSLEADLKLEMPINDFLNLRTGLQSNLLKFDANQKNIGVHTIIPYAYIFNQNKNALHLTSEWELGNFSISLGGRMEYFTSNGKPEGGKRFQQKYFNFYPNLQANYSFGDDNNTHNILFAYSKRINRPEFQQVNPNLHYRSSLLYSKGNPDISPEFAHIFELQHEWVLPNFNLSTTFFYRETNNVIQEKQSILKDDIILMTYINESKRKNIGGEMFLKLDITKWLDLTNNITIFKKTFQNTENGFTNAMNWNNKTICNIRPGYDFKIQVKAKYVGKQNSLYISSKPYFMADIGLSKSILKNKGQVYLSLTDVFNNGKFKTEINQKDFSSISNTTNNTRMFRIGFLYNLRK